MPPKAFIYTRISTPKQKIGKGLKIQTQMAEQYCNENNLQIDNTINLSDEGQSAFHGNHISLGKLGQFLRLVEDGKIPIGSYLIFQSLDRMSRQDAMTALGIFNQIIQSGINVVTLMPPRTYTKKDLENQQYSIIEIVVTFIRAFEESDIKSKRHIENWKRKREEARKEGKLLTKKYPMWLRYDEKEKKFIPIAERVKTIKKIYELAFKDYGKSYIANRLNESNRDMPNTYPVWRGKIWQASSISKILRNRQLIGKFQPHHYIKNPGEKRKRVPQGEPIENYFPKVISERLFYAVQEKLSKRKTIVGNQQKISNLFTSIMKCGLCKSTIVYDDKSSKRNKSKNAKYLICSKARAHNGCEWHKLIYDVWEKEFFSAILEIDIDDLLKYQGRERAERVETLKMKIAEKNFKEKEISKSIDNLLGLLDMDIPDVKDKINRLHQEREEIQKSKVEDEEELFSLTEYVEKTYRSFKSIEEIAKQIDSINNEDEKSRYDSRLRLRNAVHDVVDDIWYFPNGTMDLDLKEWFEFEGDEADLPDDIREWKGIKNPCAIVSLAQPRSIKGIENGFFIKIVMPK